MALQLALTTLESLAEMLNERKREAEQFAAFRDKLRSISGKLSTPRAMSSGDSDYPSINGHNSPGNGTGGRFLLREDDMMQLEFNTNGLISRSKPRRLLLLNDLLGRHSVKICVKSVFGSVESRKYAILEFLPFLNFGFGEFLYFIRVEIYTKKNLEYPRSVHLSVVLTRSQI